MFQNIIQVIFRNIYKHKFYSFINIAGLTLGFAAFIVISLFIYYELNWDTNNVNYPHIYRVQQRINNQGDIWTQVPPAIPQALKNKYPEIEQSILVREAWGEYLSVDGNEQFFEDEGYYADQDFFSVFTVNFVSGAADKALEDPNSIILSEKLAHKLFGDKDPVGKIIIVDKVNALKITAIFKDFPKNTHLTPSYISSFGAFETIRNWKGFRLQWESNSFRCYVLIKPGADIDALNKKIAGIYPENTVKKNKFKPYLQPLSLVYLSPTGRGDYMAAIFMYCIIAIMLLMLSAINYINHTTAYATIRAKEIAVRKVNGSSKALLVIQFLAESVITSIIACIIALVLVSLILPFFNQMVDRELMLSFSGAGLYYSFLFGVAVLVGVLSGLYPAFFMSSVKLVALLKGEIFHIKHVKGGVRKVLVTFQFVASILLVIVTLFMTRQINYSMKKDLGFKQENLLFAGFKNVKDSVSFENIKNKLLSYPFIQDITVSSNIPFYSSDGKIVGWEGAQPDEREDVRYTVVNYDYVKTIGLQIVKGRNFSPDMPSDINKTCLINETAWRRFGWKDPIGRKIEKDRWTVIGVVKDFHPYSVHEKIPPCLIELDSYQNMKNWMVVSCRIQPGAAKEAKIVMEHELNSFYPKDPFEIREFTEHYKTDRTFKNYKIIRDTFLLFAVVNIFLTIFGLFGLVSFTIQRRTKEIGVRKINGSSVWSIFIMLNKEYSLLILIATLIAWPIGYYSYFTMPFNYRFTIGGWEYVFATMLVYIISLLTTGYYTYRAATRNPIDALRYE